MQELYDRRTLHNIVGVKPLPVIVKSSDEIGSRKPESSRSKSKASRAVESIWDTEDTSHALDHEEYYSRGRRHRPAADEERGRYDIGQPSKKRRKMGRESDAHTVVFVDDDDEERRTDEDEERGYMSFEDERRPALSRRSSEKSGRRRSYWLSKGTGPPDDQSS